MRGNHLLAKVLVLASFGGYATSVTHGQAFPEGPISGNASGVSVEHAKFLSGRGQFAAADRELRAYLSTHPGDSAALYELGSVLHRENQPKESLAAYTEAAKGTTPTPQQLRIVALDYVLLDDSADAVRWLERAVAGQPDNFEAWYDLGRAQMMQKDFPAAEVALKRSLTLQHETVGSAGAVKAENNLGVTYEAEGRSAEAGAAYRNAIEWQRSFAHPGAEPGAHPSEQPLLNYGKMLTDQNRANEAVEFLEEAVRYAPNDPKCHEQLARALDHSTETGDRAQAEMLEAVRLDPSNARLHFQLGLMYRHAGKKELSREQMALSGSLYGSHSTSTDR